jgi:uncharacterized protein YlxP (DUF503 family)
VIVAILQFELLIPGATSLKDKRRVVASLKDRLHREHQVSVAEIGLLDIPHAARMGLALVSSDARHASATLDRITAKLRSLRDAELGDITREILRDPVAPEGDAPPPCEDHALDEEMLRRAGEIPT